jgi:hypothetical protein
MEKHRPRKRIGRRLLTAGAGLAAMALVGCGGDSKHVYGVVPQPQPDLAEQHVYGVVPYLPDMSPGDAETHVYGVVPCCPDLASDDQK